LLVLLLFVFPLDCRCHFVVNAVALLADLLSFMLSWRVVYDVVVAALKR